VIGTSYPLLDVFLWMLEFFLFFLWVFLVVTIALDIFRSHDLSGGWKFFWVLFIIVLPFLGSFLYLILRGGGMHDRAVQAAQAQQQAFDEYVRQAAGGSSTVDELARLAQLRESGAINESEYEAAKAKVLGHTPSAPPPA
jgi:hypothetical protein